MSTSASASSNSSSLNAAIESNSACMVKAILQWGVCDANAKVEYPAVKFYDEVAQWSAPFNKRIIPIGTHEKILFEERPLGEPMPFTTSLHLAIINIYHSFKGNEKKNAIGILKYLLSAGADPRASSHKLVLPFIEGYNCLSCSECNALQFAVYLRMFLQKGHEEETGNNIDDAIELIVQKINDNASVQAKAAKVAYIAKPSTSSILTATLDVYSKLLLSDSFSDIEFLCSDGVSLHAHKSILAAASTYFKVAFEGPWAETHLDGVWKTSHSSELMKATLTMIYTGDPKLCKVLCTGFITVEMFEVASEYDLQGMIPLVVGNCIHSLDQANVTPLLRAALVHENSTLQRGCLEFIMDHPDLLSSEPDLVSLVILSFRETNISTMLRAALERKSIPLQEACFQFIKKQPVTLTQRDMLALAVEQKDTWRTLMSFLRVPSKPDSEYVAVAVAVTGENVDSNVNAIETQNRPDKKRGRFE